MNAIYQWEGMTPFGHWLCWGIFIFVMVLAVITYKQEQGKKD